MKGTRYLLDTPVLLAWLDEGSALNPSIRQTIDDGNNEIFVSASTIWEIANMTASGKLKAPQDLLKIFAQNNIGILPISGEHAYAIQGLPDLHQEPSDRMLIVQASLEGLTIITQSTAIQAYPVLCLSA